MSVIAWDGTTLAADKRAVNGSLLHQCTKIIKHNGTLYGITGAWSDGAELRAWHMAGADPEKFPAKAREDKATLIVINRTGIHCYESGPYPITYESEMQAWGSGRDFAEAAMHLGLNAREAVDVACRFDTSCGNGCDVLTLEEEP